MKYFKKVGSVTLSVALAATMLSGTAVTAFAGAPAANPYAPTEYVEHDGATFGRATEAYGKDYVGFPLFNGNPDDFDEYLDLITDEIGNYGVITLATSGNAKGSYTAKDGSTVTYTVPAGKATGGEALQGAAGQTALSTVMYQAQSWNTDLINDIGYLMGSENKSKQNNGEYFFTNSTGTSMTDMRLNPLSGRYDEGYGEDSAMASIFAAANSNGYNGYEADENGFYIMASVNTKHYSVYNAQWFRPVANTQVGVRSFYEYNAKSANKGFADGAISSFMSSYGRINGVPSSASFITHWANKVSKYDLYNGTDAGADTPYLTIAQSGNNTYGQFGNGYDEAYSPDATWKASSMAISGHKASGSPDLLADAIDKGYNGITIDSCKFVANGYLTIRTRTGIYDEKDANGLSKYYPFNDIAANGSKAVTYKSASSQKIAMQNAEEGIVLLKNDNNVLPLAKTDNVGVYGPFSQAINSGIYQVALSDYTDRGEEAGNSPYESLSKRVADTSYDMGLNVVTITTANGGYWYVDGTAIVVKTAEEFAAATEKDNYYFGILESGQNSTSIYSYGADKWIRCAVTDATVGYDAYAGWTSPLFDDSFLWHNPSYVAVDSAVTWKNVPNQGLPPVLSQYPYHLILENAGAEDTYYIHAGGRINGVSFVTGVAPIVAKNYGYYFEVQDNNMIDLGGATKGDNSSLGGGIAYLQNAKDKSAMTFKVNEVKPYGYAAASYVAEDDAAVIFVGQSYLGLSGEGTDRMSLEMGAGQVESALNVAKTYKEAGKDTVVVVYADYPVIVEALQNSEYVDAILFAGYGGQFGGKATAEVLTGEYAPTGRLVSTWYSDMDLFPAISEYSIPLGNDILQPIADTGLTLDQIDDCITVDMSNADIVNTGLTYKYLSDEDVAEHVTYPFGYGLSYSNFKWSNMQVSANADGTYNVKVSVKNTGRVGTSDVVQIYVTKNDKSAYGTAAPKKSLAGFAKVYVSAGATKTVNVTVDPSYFSIWDVNAEDYIVEGGEYSFYAAADSTLNDALVATVNIQGDKVAALPLNKEVNIWEHSYNAQNVHYDEYSKVQTAKAAVSEEVGDDIYAVTAKEAGAWTVMPNVNLTNVKKATLVAGAPAGVNGTIELRLDAPNGTKIASFDVAATGEATVELASNTEAKQTIKEQGYNTIDAAVTAASGAHDVYVVFNAKDLRAATLTLTQSASATWKQNAKGYWYVHEDGTYPVNTWEKINGKWYHFDAAGYMQSGWLADAGKWYYLGAANDGAMKTGWQAINGKWYYFAASGAMQSGWLLDGTTWYYLGAANDGAMKTGWQAINGKWYYFAASGAMMTGWQQINGKWYYMYDNGAMAANTYIGSYYVNANGEWVK